MHFNDHSTIFRRCTALAAIGFLLWTLSESTFLNASTNFVEKKLQTVKKLSDQTAEHLASVTQHILHW
jgi:hypothetical protein